MKGEDFQPKTFFMLHGNEARGNFEIIEWNRWILHLLKMKQLLQGSRQQLEQIWEDEDEMKDLPFNAKTFFLLHGENCHCLSRRC